METRTLTIGELNRMQAICTGEISRLQNSLGSVRNSPVRSAIEAQIRGYELTRSKLAAMEHDKREGTA